MQPIMAKPPVTTRSAAADIIRQWRKTGNFPDRAIHAVTEHRAALMEMVYGTIRLFRRLEAVRAELAPRRPATDIDCVLLLGLYQVLYMDQAADHTGHTGHGGSQSIAPPRSAKPSQGCAKQQEQQEESGKEDAATRATKVRRVTATL